MKTTRREFNGTAGEWVKSTEYTKNHSYLCVNAIHPERGYKSNVYKSMIGEDECDVEGCGCCIESQADAKLIANAKNLLYTLQGLVIEIEHMNIDVDLHTAKSLLDKIFI